MAAPEDRPHDGGPAVEVVYLNTNEEVKFHASWDDTLAQVWDEAYRKLEETRREGDEFQCQDGVSLMQYLNLTLAELRERHICQNRKFAIRSETGGA
jgi:hypothetical protein